MKRNLQAFALNRKKNKIALAKGKEKSALKLKKVTWAGRVKMVWWPLTLRGSAGLVGHSCDVSPSFFFDPNITN